MFTFVLLVLAAVVIEMLMKNTIHFYCIIFMLKGQFQRYIFVNFLIFLDIFFTVLFVEIWITD
jgi:hypothetical protein